MVDIKNGYDREWYNRLLIISTHELIQSVDGSFLKRCNDQRKHIAFFSVFLFFAFYVIFYSSNISYSAYPKVLNINEWVKKVLSSSPVIDQSWRYIYDISGLCGRNHNFFWTSCRP